MTTNIKTLNKLMKKKWIIDNITVIFLYLHDINLRQILIFNIPCEIKSH